MKKYTLIIIYNEKTEKLEVLKESITNLKPKIVMRPKIIKLIEKANLIDELVIPFDGEILGES